MSQSTDTVVTPLAELRTFVPSFAARCRAARWFHPLAWVRTLGAIVDDIGKDYAFTAREAHAAEVEDLEADKELAAALTELEAALEGGLCNTDIPRVREAIARVRLARKQVARSAARDRNIAEAARG